MRADPHHQLDVVLDEQDGNAALGGDPTQGALELAPSRPSPGPRTARPAAVPGRGGQGPTQLDQPRRSERQPENGPVGDGPQSEQFDELADLARLARIGRMNAAHGDQVRPHPPLGIPDPMPEHEVLAHGQTEEQLGVLEGPGQPAAGPDLGPDPRSRPRRPAAPARCGLIKPDRTPNRVLLPAPFGPTSPTMVAGGTARSTSLSATRPPKRTVTPMHARRPTAPRGGRSVISGRSPPCATRAGHRSTRRDTLASSAADLPGVLGHRALRVAGHATAPKPNSIAGTSPHRLGTYVLEHSGHQARTPARPARRPVMDRTPRVTTTANQTRPANVS